MVVILTAIRLIFFIYQQQVKTEASVIYDNEQIGVDVVEQIIKHDFRAAIQDLIRLSEDEDTISILTTGTSSNFDTVENKLINIVEWHNMYLEARVLDNSGMELICVHNIDGNVSRKPPEELQNQSKRSYYKKTIALQKGEVSFSSFDLNMNYGKIITPYIPVIHMATPVFSEDGKPIGIVILNYKGERILTEIENAEKNRPGIFLLLNTDGFFLKGFNEEDEWGFLIEDRADKNFQTLFPENWEKIRTGRTGKIQNEHEQLIYETINLKEEASSILQNLPISKPYNISTEAENDIILVSYLSQETIKGIIKTNLGSLPLRLLLTGIGIIIVIIIIAFTLILFRLRLLDSLTELKNSERRYRTLINISPVGIFHTNKEGLYEYVNQRWCDITGLKPDEVIGRAEASPLHPDYKDPVLKKWRNLISNGAPFSLQYPLKRENKTVWVLGAAVAEKDEKGLHSGFIGTLTDISEQKDIEKQLNDDKLKYSSVLDLAADAIITINDVGIIKEFNSTALRYFGYELEEIIGQNVMVLAPEPHRSRHQGYIESYLKTGIAKIIGFPREISAVRKDGSVFPMELSVGEVLVEGERLFTGIIRDISERKDAEKQLLESEQFANATLDSLNASVVIINKSGRIIGVNQSWRELIKEFAGANKENPIGTNYFDVADMDASILDHKDAVSFVNGIKDVFKGKIDIFKQEYPFQTSNSKGWFIGSVTRFERDNNKFAVISHENITDRVLAEEKLRQFKTTLDQTQDAVFIFNAESLQFLYANHGAVKQLGYTLDELTLISPVDISNEYTEETFREMISSIRDPESDSILLETTYLRKDGSQFPADVRIQYIEESIDSSFIVIARDISEQKRINLELEQAKVAAEQAAVSKSEFLANMSHEIRTPMNAIIGMTYLTLQTGLTDKQKDYLLKINNASKALLGIINDILDFSKIEAGKMSLEKIPIKLSDIIDDMFNLLSKNIEDKGLELLIDVDSDIPEGLIGDPIRIGQIFTNLLNNAVKFTEKGEIDIHIKMLKKTAGTVTLECSFSDTGIGMSPEQTKNLFQKFSQADTSTTRKYGGTGLGLTICRQLIELMGGEISVNSKKGEGTTFRFSIKLNVQKSYQSKNSKIVPRDIKDLKGLLISGSLKSASLLERQLNSLTFQVETSISCEQASELLNDTLRNRLPFELIILDYAVIKNECSLLSKLIQDRNLALIPLIVISASKTFTKAAESVKNRTMCSLIKKPVTHSSLFNAIMDVFGHEGLKVTRDSDYQVDDKEFLDNIYNSTILLVEDNKINQQVASELLSRADVNLTIAENGKEALRKVQEQTFDLILMDIQMPVMDGIEATKRIRKLKSPADKVPIIAMTAHAMAEDKKNSINAGISDYLTKPIDPKEFYSCLSRWLKPALKRTQPISIKTDRNEIDFPDAIRGIDLEAALERVAGNKKLYKNLLNDFISENRDFSALLSAALKDLDNSTAKRLIHTLKGVAGNLGANSLQEKTEELEEAVINHSENISSLLGETSEILSALIAEIHERIKPEKQSNAEKHNLSEKEIHDSKVKIGRFRESLAMSDMESLDLFNELRVYFSIEYPEFVDQITKELEALNFEKTLKILDTINT